MIVITTPAGQIGRQVLGNLLQSGERLRVIARDPSQLPAEVREDLDIVEGSHGEAGFVTGSLAMDDLIAASGVAYRALTNPYFMEDTARQAESIKIQGLFSWPIAGDRKRPTVVTRLSSGSSVALWVDTGDVSVIP